MYGSTMAKNLAKTLAENQQKNNSMITALLRNTGNEERFMIQRLFP